jgi:hypothetical protein
MANVNVTSAIVAKESLAILKNMLTFSAGVNRDWEQTFNTAVGQGYEPGQTIQIKRPPRYTYRAGRVAVPQSTAITSVPLTLSQGGCDLSFTSAERTLTFTKLQDKIAAAIATVANEIDRQGLEMTRTSVFNALNAGGALPTTQALALAAFTDMGVRLDNMAAPRQDNRRYVVMSPAMNGAGVQGLAGLFNSGDKISAQYRSGMIESNTLGYRGMGMDQNVVVHTNGSQPAGPTANAVAGGGQTGSAITVNGAAITGTITRGSVISFGGVNAVNPQSRQDTGEAAQFVVTADVAIGATSIPISPAIVATGAFQNVTASPLNNATLTVHGTANTGYAQNIAYHKDAFTLAMVPMWAPPANGVMSVKSEESDGFRLKVTEFYDGTNDQMVMRIDVLFGWAATYPELATKYYTVR